VVRFHAQLEKSAAEQHLNRALPGAPFVGRTKRYKTGKIAALKQWWA
jgi:hypothetical protein